MNAGRNWQNERKIIEKHADDRVALIAQSHARVTGKTLVADNPSLSDALWNLPAVILAHDTQADPVFFYANRAALTLFEASASDFILLPSRYSAEPMERDKRNKLLARVAADNFIPDYSGIRISQGGRRFQITQAMVWNLLDDSGKIQGQAACFDQWKAL